MANNQFADGQGYDYDEAGNVTQDAEGKKFLYDGENKQKSFGVGGSSTNGGTYVYDGDGRRVKKIVGTEVTIFVYNAAGQMVAEYATTAPTSPLVNYLTSDTLGSPRINTDANGAVIARHDYMPFGEELFSTGNRVSGVGYGGDGVRKQFTGYERDEESGLDFAQARMYSSRFGRFSSADPLFITMNRLLDPQQLNIYVYVRNAPLQYTDPTGLDITIKGSEVDWALQQLGEGLSFSIDKNKDGKVIIVDSNGKQLDANALKALGDKLSGPEKALFGAITNVNTHATLSATTNDDSVDGGSAVKKGHNAVDRAELEMLGKSDGDGGATSSDAVKHEALEAFRTASGIGPQEAHEQNPYDGYFFIPESAEFDSQGKTTKQTVTAIGGRTDANGNYTGTYRLVKELHPPMKIKEGVVPRGSIVSITYVPNPK